jgi:hypothetical protein
MATQDDVFQQYLSSQEKRDRMQMIASAGQGRGGGVSGSVAPLSTALTTSGNPYAMGAGIALQAGAGLYDAFKGGEAEEAAAKRQAKMDRWAEEDRAEGKRDRNTSMLERRQDRMSSVFQQYLERQKGQRAAGAMDYRNYNREGFRGA